MNKAITDIRGMDTAELRAKLQDLHKEQFGLKFRGNPEQVAKTSRHREIRRTIARIKMVLGERAGGTAPIVTAAAPAKSAARTAKTAKAGKAGAGAATKSATAKSAGTKKAGKQ